MKRLNNIDWTFPLRLISVLVFLLTAGDLRSDEEKRQ